MANQAEEEVRRRLGGRSLRDIVTGVVDSQPMGQLLDFQGINVGFEDCNVAVQTSCGRYVVKVFAFDRVDGVAERTAGIIDAAVTAGVDHPALLRSGSGSPLHRSEVSGLCYLVMEEIQGQSFYSLERPPAANELATLVGQLARLHSSPHHPSYLLDPWAIPNLANLHSRVGPALNSRDHAAVEAVVADLSCVESPLPTALIHGDVTKGNVLVGGGRVYLIDYASANQWPRIQELAVIAANLMYGSDLNLDDRMRFLADLYSEHTELNGAEQRALPVYARAAAAMELIGAVYEREVKGNDSAETGLIYEIGASALHSVS